MKEAWEKFWGRIALIIFLVVAAVVVALIGATQDASNPVTSFVTGVVMICGVIWEAGSELLAKLNWHIPWPW